MPVSRLPVSEDNPPSFQIVGRQLDPDAVAWKHANAVAAHLAAAVGERVVSVFQLDPEEAAPKRFGHLTLELELFLLLSHAHAAPAGR